MEKVKCFLSDFRDLKKKLNRVGAVDTLELAIAEIDVILNKYHADNYIFFDYTDPYGLYNLLNEE